MMVWSKETASKPCDKKSSHHSLQNQKHHSLQNQKHEVPMMLNSSSKNSQKRKCMRYMNDGTFVTSSEFVTKKKYETDNAKAQKLKSSSHAQNDPIEFCTVSTQDYSHLSDVEDSAKRPSYLMNEESFYIHVGDLMDNSYSDGIATSIKEKLKEEDMDFADSRKKFLPSRGNHLPRPFIPIGPRFQAEVPKWEAPTNIYNSDDCLKWLGTQIWPMASFSRDNAKNIGKDMSDSSSGENIESIDHVKKHGEARECLNSKVNDTFTSWKFDYKEDVSKSWTMEDEKKFESLVKLNLLSNDSKFWKLSMEYFPSKSIECMMNYYYNVYIPRCISIEEKISL